MNSIAKTIIGILTGGLITFLLLWQIEGCNYKKQIAILNSRIANCENAPTKTDTIWRHDTVVINKVKVLTNYKTDTIVVNGHIVEVNSYKDTLKTKDFDLNYGVKVIGVLKEVEFPSYTLHTKEIITTKTVTLHDTITLYKPKSHLFLYGGITLNNIKTFPGLQAGLGWTIKDRVAVMPGILYNTDSKLYGQLSVGVYLK